MLVGYTTDKDKTGEVYLVLDSSIKSSLKVLHFY